jgi:hypothetical protein
MTHAKPCVVTAGWDRELAASVAACDTLILPELPMLALHPHAFDAAWS